MWLQHKIEKKKENRGGKKKKKKPTAKYKRTTITKTTPIVNYAFRTWQPNLL
jgi:hypothetical protein